MYKTTTTRLFLAAALATGLALSGCGEDPKQKIDPQEHETDKKNPAESTLFQVGNEFFAIPSPIQTSVLIKKSGASYSKELLNDARNAPSYSTKFYRALNLGIFGADMGYATLYDQFKEAMQYMQSCRRLGEELGVSGAFSPELYERFGVHVESGHQDSLLAMVSDAYRHSDKFLKDNDREDVSALILAGGWIETLHFAANVADFSGHSDVVNRIGEQKSTLENLIKLMQKNANDEDYLELIEQLEELYHLFDGVKVTYIYEKPSIDETTKTAVINSTSKVEITKEELKAIYEKIEAIRAQIVS